MPNSAYLNVMVPWVGDNTSIPQVLMVGDFISCSGV